MPLNPMTFQNEFERKMLDWTLIDDKTDIIGINQNNHSPEPFDFAREFSSAYKTYAEEGMIVGVDISAMSSQASSAMEGILRRITGSNVPQSTILATAFATFWSIIAGSSVHTLEHGGIAGVGVTNTAMSMVGAIDAAIKSKITSTGDVNAWATFIEAVEGIVKTIVWTVVEMFTCGPSLCPISFPEMVS